MNIIMVRIMFLTPRTEIRSRPELPLKYRHCEIVCLRRAEARDARFREISPTEWMAKSGRERLVLAEIVALRCCLDKCGHVSALFYSLLGGMGVTAGAHRLWAHRSYKANVIYRAILVSMNTITFQVR